MWINRDFSKYWDLSTLPVRVLLGPRQAGKSSFLKKQMEPERKWISLDDLATREIANSDPETLLLHSSQKFVIDEIQYAPALVNAIKNKVDTWRLSARVGVEPSFWITGSNQILLHKNIQESLAGRANYFSFFPFSIHELVEASLEVSPEVLFSKGSWPELHVNNQLNTVDYLNDYISTVIEKDIAQSAGIAKTQEYIKAVRLLAGRTGQMLVLSNIAQDAGIKQPTLDGWVSSLEAMRVVTRIKPFYPSRNDRLIRAPKLFFNDVGLAVRLQGWTQIQPLLVSPAVGALFETLVFSEILKASSLFGRDWDVMYSRNKEGDEVDFIIEGSNQKTIAIEVKWSSTEAAQWSMPSAMRKVIGQIPTYVVSFVGGATSKPGIKHISIYELFLMLQQELAS